MSTILARRSPLAATLAIAAVIGAIAATVRPGPPAAVAPAAAQAARIPDKLQFAIDPPADDPGALNGPFDLDVGPDGSLYVADWGNHRVQRFGPGGDVRDVWGSYGPGDGLFVRPESLAVAPAGSPRAGVVYVCTPGAGSVQVFDPAGTWLGMLPIGDVATLPAAVTVAPDGEVLVSDRRSRRVHRFDPFGRHRGAIGTGAEAGDGAIKEPARTAVAPDGSVYVIDRGNMRVMRFARDGAFLGQWGKPGTGDGDFALASDVWAAPDGTVFVVDRNRPRVQRFSATGAFLAGWGARGQGPGELAGPIGIAPAGEGAFYLVEWDNRRVQRFTFDGAVTGVVGHAGSPTADPPIDAVIDGQGRLLVAQGPRIAVRDALGNPVATWGGPGEGDGQFGAAGAGALAVGPDGSFYATDPAMGRIQRFAADGRFLAAWGGPGDAPGKFQTPADLAVGEDGRVYVVDEGGPAHDRVQVFAPDGSLLGVWGGRGDAKGRLWLPRPIAVAPDGSVYVGELVNRRVQRFDPSGTPLAMFGSIWPSECDPFLSNLYPNGLAAAPNGDVLAMANGGVFLFTSRGALVGPWRFAGDPVDFHEQGGLGNLALGRRGRAVSVVPGLRRMLVFGPEFASSWRAEHFPNRWLAGPPAAITEVDDLALDWGDGPPAAGLPADGASARFTRTVDLAAGAYRFTVDARGGVRLWVGARLLVDAWGGGEGPAGDVHLEATVRVMAGPARIRLDYNDSGGPARVALRYERLDDAPPTATVTRTPLPTPTRAVPPTRPRPAARLWLPAAFKHVPARPHPDSPAPFVANPAIDVQSYDIDLAAPGLGEQVIDVTERLVVRARQPLRAVDLDLEPNSVRLGTVEANGRPTEYGWLEGRPNAYGLSGSRLRIALAGALAAGEDVSLTLRYSLDPATFVRDRGLIYDPAFGGRKVLATYPFPYHTRTWLPSHDHPSDPATVTFTLRVPDGMLAVANGALVEGTYEAGGGLDAAGLRVFRWSPTTPITTYSIAVVMGELAVHHEDVCFDVDDSGAPGSRVDCAAAGRRLPLVFYYPAGSADRDALLAGVHVAADAVVHFSGLLGPFPFDKLGFAYAPQPSANGAPGLITLHSTIDARPQVTVHEALHSWWGNGAWAYADTWGDAWLSEGAASYFAGDYTQVRFGTYASIPCPCAAGPVVFPWSSDPLDVYNAQAAVGGGPAGGPLVYCKGEAALYDLRWRIGDLLGMDEFDAPASDVFYRLMRGAYAAFRFKPLTTEAFIAHVRALLAGAYRAEGRAVEDAAVGRLVDGWVARWGLARPD